MSERRGRERPAAAPVLATASSTSRRQVPIQAVPSGRRGGSKLLEAEEALRVSDQLYRSVVDNLAKGVVVQDAAGRIIASNPAAREILGLDVDELTGRTSFDPEWHAVWADGTPAVGADHPATVARTTGRAVTDVVMGVRHGSGVMRWLHVSARPLRDASAETVTGVVISFLDVTERWRIEQALRDAEALLNQTQALTKVGGWAYDVGATRVIWTEEVYRIHELPRDYDPNSAEHDIEFYAPDDQARIAEAFRLSFEEGRPYDLTLRLTTAKGRAIWVRTVGQPQLEDGRVVRVYGTIADITEQRRADEELQVAHARLRRFIDANMLGVVIGDARGAIVEANEYYLDLIGYTRAQLNAGEIDWRAITPPEWLPVSEQAVAEQRERGVSTPYEKEYQRRDGSRVPVLVGGTTLPGSGGEIAAFVIDISERKRAEQEVLALNAALEDRVKQRTTALEAANRELEAFSYSVSHDLRAPLRSIDGFSRILIRDHAEQLDSEAQRLLGIVVRNVGQMGALIDDLLAFSRVTRQELESRPVQMGRLARSVADGLAAAEPGRQIEFEIGDLCTIAGDQALLRQVWTNLLGNAAKFTRPAERPRVEVRCEEGASETRFSVRDNGVGFDADYAGNLFKPFQRLHPTTEFEGTGIGLAIVARIVQRHGGRVWAEGAPGAGATFGFAIPTTTETP